MDQTCASKTIQCFVEIPTLTSFRKAKYRSIADDEFNSDLEYEGVDCVVGKVVDGKHSHLYVRYLDGVVHRVSFSAFCKMSPNFCSEVLRQRGLLPCPCQIIDCRFYVDCPRASDSLNPDTNLIS